MKRTDLLPLPPRDFLILFSLTEGPLHGYGLVKAIEEESEGMVRMDPANLYRALRRLERDGLVEEVEAAEDVEAEAGEERRRYYALTVLGHAVVAEEVARVKRLVGTARARRLLAMREGGR